MRVGDLIEFICLPHCPTTCSLSCVVADDGFYTMPELPPIVSLPTSAPLSSYSGPSPPSDVTSPHVNADEHR